MSSSATPRPRASLSLDLDDKWSYLRVRANPAWEERPSYLPEVVPRLLAFFAERELTITFFVVGEDAERTDRRPLLRSIADAGHELANHSHSHQPWFHLFDRARTEHEIRAAEEAIAVAGGQPVHGFRGPGYSVSQAALEILVERGYLYDASTLPTFIGPLARWYYLRTANLSAEERARRSQLFGQWRDGRRPNRPYTWSLPGGTLLEIPVSTAPLARTPIHTSYLLYLRRLGRLAPLLYLRAGLALCRLTATPPSLLLHPLDFLGRGDDRDLAFFPAMDLPRGDKLDLLSRAIALVARHWELGPLLAQARGLEGSRLRRVGLDGRDVGLRGSSTG